MGLKKQNYESNKLGLTLPNAYAVVYSLKINGNCGYANIRVQTTRERALTMPPIEEYDVSFRVNRAENPLTTAYNTIKGQREFEVWNEETHQLETKVEYMPLYGWEDDIEVAESDEPAEEAQPEAVQE